MKVKGGSNNIDPKTCLIKMVIWYFLFGAAHELIHALAAFSFDLHHGMMYNNESVLLFLLRITLGRALHLPLMEKSATDLQFALVRHVGWIFSLCIAFAFANSNNIPNKKEAKTAAIITAMEAVATDLLGFGAVGRATFLCGNFGLILVNPAWTSGPDHGKTALQILKKLVEVTMMRGAQTGGVVCWAEGATGDGELCGIRSRVVNGKRTDLSEGVCKKVYKDAFSRGRIKKGIQGFFGHTRFATSSKATFDGTHPHQWSSPRRWRVYDAATMKLKNPQPRMATVENFITHNGDLDFFRVGRKFYDLHTVQSWLEKGTGNPMPASVDSAAIAGIVDILRTSGSFGLSIRYSILLGSPSSTMDTDVILPSLEEFELAGEIFESALTELCKEKNVSVCNISYSDELRSDFVAKVTPDIPDLRKRVSSFCDLLSTDDEKGVGIPAHEFVKATIDAFLDNDLFQTTKFFLENAKGSFGLTVTSSLDASRQICIAARGQTMSIAFYPRKGLICYGSEQAAVKAGMNYTCPGGDIPCASAFLRAEKNTFDDVTVRVDLDDLGGEICLIDWGDKSSDLVSYPNRFLKQHIALDGKVRVGFHQQSKNVEDQIHRRFTLLECNEFIKPLSEIPSDLVLQEIQSIPMACQKIQDDWYGSSLNRLTAWNFSRCLRARLLARVEEKVQVHAGTVDILLSGCEVSLWLAEQFASDLQKAFPKLFIKTVSSNKMLGMFGQELTIPSVGFPMSQKTHDLSETIVIIVSHSGGTFAPLACSNLLQSVTQNMFVVTSEWDTQIGKQLRSMSGGLLSSRIFSTDVGVSPAEPCSLSVAAQHQLLTQLFQTISITILGDKGFRHITGAAMTDTDVKILERCNKDNIKALESIVGVNREGNGLSEESNMTEKALRERGRVWSDHILENARALIMTFVYIVVTVTIGYPLITGLSVAGGVDNGSVFYATRFFDSLIYFFLPQINVLILRLLQKRNLRHRMVGRTVVVGDIPWVSQAADAFLSKIFACSYSIAGLNVLHGNPADHLVHRHTHRVVRGSLLVCGRPDGRLMSLTSAEATVCLSVCQASSIQSIGGTCESVTIGHNPSKMSLTAENIFLETHRPKFLCEQLLEEEHYEVLDGSTEAAEPDADQMNTSPHYLLGTYSSWLHNIRQKHDQKFTTCSQSTTELSHIDRTVENLIREKGEHKRLKKIFDDIDEDGNGQLGVRDFLSAYQKVDSQLDEKDILTLFKEIDVDESGRLDFNEFMMAASMPKSQLLRKLDRSDKGASTMLDAESSKEAFFGELARTKVRECRTTNFSLCEAQYLSMELYEGRIASMQRFVAMTVMFHEMGLRVERFFPRLSFGYLGYRMDRTHSIMRIATTASPVSGSDVRERMDSLKLMDTILKAVNVISTAWYDYRSAESKQLLARLRGVPDTVRSPVGEK